MLRTILMLIGMMLVGPAMVVADRWPEFRGPGGEGHSDCVGQPLVWSESENVTWKSAVPGIGWSSPVVWDDQIWMTTATQDGRELNAICLDRKSGKMLHNVKVFEVEKPADIQNFNSHASPSPVIDSGRLYVHFGTNGTACLNTSTAEVIWSRRDLNLEHQVGPGSSPILVGDLLVVNCDGMDVQYVIGLEKSTGRTVWKTDRSVDLSENTKDENKAFSTPLLIQGDSRTDLISTGAQAAFGYDPQTGSEQWKVLFDGFSNVARPVYGQGLVIVNTGFTSPEFLAIRVGGTGDVTESHIAWRFGRSVPARSSPILIGDLLYFVSDGGVASCVELRNGESVWKQRIGGEFSASPVYVDGRIYFLDHSGKTTVVAAGHRYEPLATNQLEGTFRGSMAIVGKAFLIRSTSHLYRVENSVVP